MSHRHKDLESISSEFGFNLLSRIWWRAQLSEAAIQMRNGLTSRAPAITMTSNVEDKLPYLGTKRVSASQVHFRYRKTKAQGILTTRMARSGSVLGVECCHYDCDEEL